MRPWLVGAIWLGWLVVTASTGYTGSRSGDRIDARATSISVWADVASLVALLVAVGIAVFVPFGAAGGDAWLPIGAGLVVLGLALRHWAATTLGAFFSRSVLIRAGYRIVDSGPYRFVRHPGYAGVLLSFIGLGLSLGNWLSVVVMLVGFFVAHVPRIRAEEGVLEANFGEPYRQFERTRKRLIPGLW